MTTGLTQQASLGSSSRRSRWTVAPAAVVLGAAAIAAAACGTTQPAASANAAAPGQSPNGQVMVNCGQGLQAMIRPVLMNGQAVSQVDCLPAAQVNPAYQQTAYAQQPNAQAYAPAPAPAAYAYGPAPVAAPAPAPQPAYASYREPAAVPSASNVRRTSNYRTSGDYVQYEPARKPGRTWKKSAVIIGSSAGIGAGVGAAAGGKKGALIGAAIGGGGAAIWDQVTRRDK